MYHSIDFGPMESDHKNTFDDWHLFSSARPFVAPPLPKTRYIDILGMSGSLDYTEAPNKIPKYADREGSWEFIMLNPGDVPEYSIEDEGSYCYDWAARYSEIMAYLHGKYFDEITLEDDPLYSYQGRVWVNEYRSDPMWGRIVINYRLAPFKYHYGFIHPVIETYNQQTISTRSIMDITPRATCQPTPLHFKCTALQGASDFGQEIDVRFTNTELGIVTTKTFRNNIPIIDPDYDLNNFEKEIVVEDMVVSNIRGGTCTIELGPYPSTIIVAGVETTKYNYGPIKIEAWYKEAIL